MPEVLRASLPPPHVPLFFHHPPPHCAPILCDCRLYDSLLPLEAAVVERLVSPLSPFCSVQGLRFDAFSDVTVGHWHNFFVGVVGDVAVVEDDILWPNQVSDFRTPREAAHGTLVPPLPVDCVPLPPSPSLIEAEHTEHAKFCIDCCRAGAPP
jgi:hypothetical protein